MSLRQLLFDQAFHGLYSLLFHTISFAKKSNLQPFCYPAYVHETISCPQRPGSRV